MEDRVACECESLQRTVGGEGERDKWKWRKLQLCAVNEHRTLTFTTRQPLGVVRPGLDDAAESLKADPFFKAP